MQSSPLKIFTEHFIQTQLQLEKLYQQHHPAILFVKKGKGLMSMQINEIKLSENSVVLPESKTVFTIHSISEDFEARVLTYRNDFIEKLGLKLNKLKVFKYFKTHIKESAHLPADEFNLLWTQIDLLRAVLHNKIPLNYNEDVVEHLFSAFIYTLSSSLLKQEKLNKNKMTRQEDITFEFIKNVFENLKTERSLQFYADKQQLTIRHLSSVVKSVTKRTGNQIISEFVMNEAKILLSTTNEAIYKIATDLNFSDPYSFSHFFKKHSKMSPVQYRAQST